MEVIKGNDEFILYVRKNNPHSNMSTAQIGREVWLWLRSRGGRKVQVNAPCHWGNTGTFVHGGNLPKTATQFQFKAALLPDLYRLLDTL